MSKIKSIRGREIEDSRGNPTLEVEVLTENSFSGKCQIPSGASKGKREAWELRDENGGMNMALAALNEIEEKLIGIEVENQSMLDRSMVELDGTENKKRLGGNAIIGTSIAASKAAAQEAGIGYYQYISRISGQEISFPRLFANLVEGGKHAKTPLAFQEYHLIPKGDFPLSFEILKAVQEELFKKNFVIGFGDEGGIIMDTPDISKPLEALEKILEDLGFENDAEFGLDVAASSFFDEGVYALKGSTVNRNEMIEIVTAIAKKHTLFAIEDPLEEEDFAGFAKLKRDLPNTLIIGDDITVTNVGRLSEALDRDSIGGIIIKPNQAGTLSEVFQTVKLAKEHGLKCIASHRSGETEDDFIADLAVGLGCYGVKFGAYNTRVRMIKYDRLSTIWQKEQERR